MRLPRPEQALTPAPATGYSGAGFLCQDSSHICVSIDDLIVDHLLVRNWSILVFPTGFG